MHYLSKDQWLSSVLKIDCFNLLEYRDTLKSELSNLMSPNLVSIFVNGSDSANIGKFEKLGFYFVDTNIQFSALREEVQIKKRIPNHKIRFHNPKDKNDVIKIASNSFRSNRFSRDPNIEKNYSNKVKEEWVSNFFSGNRGDYLIISENQGKVSGFLLLLKQDNKLVIDLIAVSEEFRGIGLAKDLISFAIYNPNLKYDYISVGTQGSNLYSLKLYNSINLSTLSVKYIYHRHAK